MKTSKAFLIIFINIFFLFSSWQHSESCGWWPEEEGAWKFFDASLIKQEAFKPLYFTMERLYDYEWESDENRNHENILEWKGYFKNQATEEDITYIIYKSTTKELESIKQAIRYPQFKPSGDLGNNSVVKYWLKNRDLECVDYLILAKNCEPLAIEGNDWSYPTENQTSINQMNEMAKLAGKQYTEAKNEFIRTRYAYQAIRMAHYGGNYQQTIDLFDKYLSNSKNKNNIYYWALGHKAGAMRRMGKNEALNAYLFSVVFDKSMAKRINAYYSFHIGSNEAWLQALGYCQNNHEKATLYFLRAINPYSKILEEMQAIIQLEPKSDYLDVLIGREIAKLEANLIADESWDSGNKDKISLTEYLKQLKEFLLNGIKNNQAKNAALWTVALGYCDYMLQDFNGARNSFKQIPATALTPEVKKQIEVFELMLQLGEVKKLTDSEEERLYQAIKNAKHEPLKRLLVRTFAEHYKQQGDEAKLYLSTNDLWVLRNSPQLKIVESLLKFSDKPNKTSYEKELLEKVNSKNTLLEMKGTLLMREGKLQEAHQIFKNLPSLERIIGEPTVANTWDCLSCYENGETFTRLELIEQIWEQEKLAAKGGKDAAQAYFKLGTIYYNITYFGHSWGAMAFTRSGSGYDEYSYTDCKKSMDYYQKAIDTAEKSKNQALAAEACFMAAKCEQNIYYTTQSKTWGYLEPVYDTHRTYFKKLKQNYSKTDFYNTVIKECFYLDTYAKIY